MPASLSRRLFIQWLPEEPSEATNTLVLTSPAGRFVDVRLLKRAMSPAGSHNNNLTTYELDLKDIEWAFAGMNHTTTIEGQVFEGEELEAAIRQAKAFATRNVLVDDRREPRMVHSTWRHVVDSRHKDADTVVDQAEMVVFPRMNLALEKSSMVNPATGLNTEYVEAWQDDELGDVESRTSVVFELDHHNSNARGMFIRLGKFMSGVARNGDDFFLSVTDKVDAWTAGIGEEIFPLEAAGSIAKLGQSVTCSDKSGREWKWVVVETDLV